MPHGASRGVALRICHAFCRLLAATLLVPSASLPRTVPRESAAWLVVAVVVVVIVAVIAVVSAGAFLLVALVVFARAVVALLVTRWWHPRAAWGGWLSKQKVASFCGII